MNTIHEYIYNRDIDSTSKKNRRPIGVVLATRDRDTVYVGWSKAKSIDPFDKNLGYDIAYGRAISRSTAAVPHSIKPHYERMIARAKDYFVGVPVFITEKKDDKRVTDPMKKKTAFEMGLDWINSLRKK